MIIIIINNVLGSLQTENSQEILKMASADLIWLCVRNNSSFLAKQKFDRTEFTHERLNLYNKNSFKYSGLAQKKALGITSGKYRQVNVSMKSSKKSRRPASNVVTQLHKSGFRRAAKKLAVSVKTYRPDLVNAALARLSQLNKVSRAVLGSKKAVKKHPKKTAKNAKKTTTTPQVKA